MKNNNTQPDQDLAELAQELETELERLKTRLAELESGDAATARPAAGEKTTVAAAADDSDALTAIDEEEEVSAITSRGSLVQVDVIAVESGPVNDAHAPVPPTVRFRVQKTRARRSRRRGRMGIAARIITGSCIAIALLVEPASSVSLWNQANVEGSGTQPGLFRHVRHAFRTGDIITITIDESTEADHKWTADRQKTVNINGTAAPEGNGAGRVNLLGLFFPFMNAGYASELKSENNSDRSVTLRATLAAEVVNVLPNGNLQVVAKKVTRVNSEEQLVELTGNIRPDDISATNTVSSSVIADASIRVNGTLRYTNDNKPGILERIASFLSGLFL